MFHNGNTREAYWNSYRLLESQLLRLSHSIHFDDNQINVYSSELADIINSACIKIESLAKDIYEEHIWPFQMDDGIVPESFTCGKPKRSVDKFKPHKWTREQWKFDYHCLVEIDKKFSLSKKRVNLNADKFGFMKYGDTILPFGNISIADCKGGYWEYWSRDIWHHDRHKFQSIDWCKSYQAIKHNYIQSIPTHGTVKNAIMVLSAFYLLAVFHSCLPFRRFKMKEISDYSRLKFGSELFSCSMCYRITPPCIINSAHKKIDAQRNEIPIPEDQQVLLAEQELLNDTEGFPFLITLNEESYGIVKSMVDEYCASTGLPYFDIAPYQENTGITSMDSGAILYHKVARYIKPPYYQGNLCITFNIGAKHIYENLYPHPFDYEMAKYKKQNETVLAELKVGDSVESKFCFDDKAFIGDILKLNEHTIELSVQVNGTRKTRIEPILNLIFIRKVQ